MYFRVYNNQTKAIETHHLITPIFKIDPKGTRGEIVVHISGDNLCRYQGVDTATTTIFYLSKPGNSNILSFKEYIEQSKYATTTGATEKYQYEHLEVLRAICYDNLLVDPGRITSIMNFHKYVSYRYKNDYPEKDIKQNRDINGLIYNDDYGMQEIRYNKGAVNPTQRMIYYTNKIIQNTIGNDVITALDKKSRA